MIHRLATLQDFDHVYDLYMEESANPYLTYDPMSREDFTEIYDKLLETGTLFIVENEGTIIATYRLIPKTDRQAHTIYLGSFTIKKELQGKGFGKMILVHIKAYLATQKKLRIELTVDTKNEGAIALYKRSGFEIEGLVRKSYRLSTTGKYYDEYLMAVLL
jgi:RimJ/RimL family protein N-acetyltransferase